MVKPYGSRINRQIRELKRGFEDVSRVWDRYENIRNKRALSKVGLKEKKWRGKQITTNQLTRSRLSKTQTRWTEGFEKKLGPDIYNYKTRREAIKYSQLKRGIYLTEKLTKFRENMDRIWTPDKKRPINIFNIKEAARAPLNLILGKSKITGKKRYVSELTKATEIGDLKRHNITTIKQMQKDIIAFNRAVRDAKRAINYWADNQRLITEMRTFGAQKLTIKDIIKNPSNLINYYKVKREMIKIAKTNWNATLMERFKAIFTRTGWREMMNKFEDFLAGSEFWDIYRAEVEDYKAEHGITDEEWQEMLKNSKK